MPNVVCHVLCHVCVAGSGGKSSLMRLVSVVVSCLSDISDGLSSGRHKARECAESLIFKLPSYSSRSPLTGTAHNTGIPSA